MYWLISWIVDKRSEVESAGGFGNKYVSSLPVPLTPLKKLFHRSYTRFGSFGMIGQELGQTVIG